MYEFEFTADCTREQAEFMTGLVADFAERMHFKLAGGFHEAEKPAEEIQEAEDAQDD
jgi:hypothetical protein